MANCALSCEGRSLSTMGGNNKVICLRWVVRVDYPEKVDLEPDNKSIMGVNETKVRGKRLCGTMNHDDTWWNVRGSQANVNRESDVG